MKNLLKTIVIILASTSIIFGQSNPDKKKSEIAVVNYLTSKHKNYKSISFGECFNQTYTNEVQEKIKTKKKVIYSVIHTYSIGKTMYSEMYFHLDANYEVVGNLTSEEMDKINSDLLNKSGKLDSLFNTIDLPSN